MTDPRRLLEHYARVVSRNEDAFPATLIETRGSSYRKAGARVFFDERGESTGCLSGGCLERDLLRRAAWLTRDGARIVTYDTDDLDEGGHGLGCGGSVRVLVKRAGSRDEKARAFFTKMADWLAQRSSATLATVISETRLGEHVWLDAREHDRIARPMRTHLDGLGEVLLEPWDPLSGVTLLGRGPETAPLVQLLDPLGFRVAVEPFVAEGCARALAQKAAAFGDACLVMTRSLRFDRELLSSLLPSSMRYIGVLGPAHRTERLLEEVRGAGIAVGRAERTRVFAPAGLALSCDGPFEIALAVAAQLQAIRHESRNSAINTADDALRRGFPADFGGVPLSPRHPVG